MTGNDESVKKVTVVCVIEDGRLIQVFSNGDKNSEWCIHGTKLRWSCDDCDDTHLLKPQESGFDEKAAREIADIMTPGGDGWERLAVFNGIAMYVDQMKRGVK